jgi:hypothetical protein
MLLDWLERLFLLLSRLSLSFFLSSRSRLRERSFLNVDGADDLVPSPRRE